jgi:hypothetical protein
MGASKDRSAKDLFSSGSHEAYTTAAKTPSCYKAWVVCRYFFDCPMDLKQFDLNLGIWYRCLDKPFFVALDELLDMGR